MSPLDAANPNSWLMTPVWAGTSLVTIPAIWPVRSLGMAASPCSGCGALWHAPTPTPGLTPRVTTRCSCALT